MADEQTISPEQAKEAGHKPLEAPIVYASTSFVQSVGNDFNLVFQRAVPIGSNTESVVQNAAKQEVVCVIQMSPQTLKDLSLLLPDLVERHEKTYGVLKTPYTIRREAEKKK